MRWMVSIALGGALAWGVSDALGQGFSSLDAINRCETFVEAALLPELSAQIKNPYKIACYFGLIDPQIHEDHRAVCARISRGMVNPHREVSQFMCIGAYAEFLEETGVQ